MNSAPRNYCAGVLEVELLEVFDFFTFPCFFFVFVVDEAVSVRLPLGSVCVAMLDLSVLVLWPSLVVVVVCDESDEDWA